MTIFWGIAGVAAAGAIGYALNAQHSAWPLLNYIGAAACSMVTVVMLAIIATVCFLARM